MNKIQIDKNKSIWLQFVLANEIAQGLMKINEQYLNSPYKTENQTRQLELYSMTYAMHLLYLNSVNLQNLKETLELFEFLSDVQEENSLAMIHFLKQFLLSESLSQPQTFSSLKMIQQTLKELNIDDTEALQAVHSSLLIQVSA